MVPKASDILNRTVRFLAQPELVIHETPNTDDLEAIEIMRSILEMYGVSSDELTVVKWGSQPVDWVLPDKLPAVRTVGSVFHGLRAIKRIATVERQDWEGARAYAK
jgi:hypothetical protein